MAIPPILDRFVVWHPDDKMGAARFADLNEHSHSPAFSGLAGGAVEVYARSRRLGFARSAGFNRRLCLPHGGTGGRHG